MDGMGVCRVFSAGDMSSSNRCRMVDASPERYAPDEPICHARQ